MSQVVDKVSNDNMSKVEVKELLKKGRKVSHRFFTFGEWVEERKGKIFDESGIQLDFFWEYRTGEQWDNGWFTIDDHYFNRE
jgi:hypothetical protein